jgi:hypothetical protein
MRWAEIIDRAAAEGIDSPTYRQLDVWTASGRLTADMRSGHPGGKYRWWPDAEVEVALLVARLISIGMDVDLAFQVARTAPTPDGTRLLTLDGGRPPWVRVEVGPPVENLGS